MFLKILTMRNGNSLFKFTAAILTCAVIFTSCIDDPEPPALTVLPDVFAQKQVLNGVEKYGIVFWILGNKEMQTVTVEGPGNATWTLTGDNATSRVFSLFPENADYVLVKPAQGDYKFKVKSKQAGEEAITVVDKLESAELNVMIIDTTHFVSGKLKTIWEPVQNADAYLVRLYNQNNKLVFMGPKLAKTSTNYSFGLADQGWTPGMTAESGKTYRVEVLAILYESTSSATDREYNVQFISLASTNVVWD
jgi:hypothetical protein